MNLFNNPDLDSRVSKIKAKIDKATNPGNFENLTENGIPIARRLLEETLPDLDYIKKKVGEHDENYKEVSEAIALAVSGCIKFPVSFISMIANASDFKQNRALVTQTKGKLTEATRLMGIITSLPMNYEARSMVNRVNMMITNSERQIQGGGGCFVATFAFGDYNSSEVLFLRYYRDTVLRKNELGKKFISCYYLVSPKLVQLLKTIPYSKKLSRVIIRRIITYLKK